MNNEPVCGVDEAGRGAWAGPVAAAAVILAADISGLADSKKLSPNKRLVLAEKIKAEALAWNVAFVDSKTIDRINILKASLYAMQLAVKGLSRKPVVVRVDGRDKPELPGFKVDAVIKGDSLIPQISAASIIAKVERDRLMIRLDELYPEYGFARHKGYGVREHTLALEKHGATPIHRFSFKPVKRLALKYG